jgi:hypothetical protein
MHEQIRTLVKPSKANGEATTKKGPVKKAVNKAVKKVTKKVRK